MKRENQEFMNFLKVIFSKKHFFSDKYLIECNVVGHKEENYEKKMSQNTLLFLGAIALPSVIDLFIFC